MKLAEALLERADMQKDLARLEGRIGDNALVQEGDEPAEDPKPLIAAYLEESSKLEELVQRINAVNASTSFSGTETIADAIVRRDTLGRTLRMYKSVYDKLQISPNRYSSSEVRFVRCLDPAALQNKIDDLSKQYRELDTAIQSLNWTVDLN